MSRLPGGLSSFFEGACIDPISLVSSLEMGGPPMAPAIASLAPLYAPLASSAASIITYGWQRSTGAASRTPSDRIVVSIRSPACDSARKRIKSCCRAAAEGVDEDGESLGILPSRAPDAAASRAFEELLRSGVAPDSGIVVSALSAFAMVGLGSRSIHVVATAAATIYTVAIASGASAEAAQMRALDTAFCAEAVVAAMCAAGAEGQTALVQWYFSAYCRHAAESGRLARVKTTLNGEGELNAQHIRLSDEESTLDLYEGLAVHARIVSTYCMALAVSVENAATSSSSSFSTPNHTETINDAPAHAMEAIRNLIAAQASFPGASIPMDALAAISVISRATGARALARHALVSAFLGSEPAASVGGSGGRGYSSDPSLTVLEQGADTGAFLTLLWVAGGEGGGVHVRGHQLRISDVASAWATVSPTTETAIKWPSPSVIALAEAAWLGAHAVRGDVHAEASTRAEMIAAHGSAPLRDTRYSWPPQISSVTAGDLGRTPLAMVVRVMACGVSIGRGKMVPCAPSIEDPVESFFLAGGAVDNVTVASLISQGDLSGAVAAYFLVLPPPTPPRARMQPLPELLSALLTAIALDTGAHGASMTDTATPTTPLNVHPFLIGERIRGNESVVINAIDSEARVFIDTPPRRLALISNILRAASARGIRLRLADVVAVAEVHGACGSPRLVRQDILAGNVWGVDGATLVYAAVLRGLSRSAGVSGRNLESARSDCDWLAARAAEDGVIKSPHSPPSMLGVLCEAAAMLEGVLGGAEGMATAVAQVSAFSPQTRAVVPLWSVHQAWGTSHVGAIAFSCAARAGAADVNLPLPPRSFPTATSSEVGPTPSAAAIAVAASTPHTAFCRSGRPLASVIARLRLLQLSTESPTIASYRLANGKGALTTDALASLTAIVSSSSSNNTQVAVIDMPAPAPGLALAQEHTTTTTSIPNAPTFAPTPRPPPSTNENISPLPPTISTSTLLPLPANGPVTSIAGFFFIGADTASVVETPAMSDRPVQSSRLVPVGAWANQRPISLIPTYAAAAAAAVMAAAPGASNMPTPAAQAPSPSPSLTHLPTQAQARAQAKQAKNEIVILSSFLSNVRPVSAAMVATLLSAPAWRFAEAGNVETDFVKSSRNKASFASQ